MKSFKEWLNEDQYYDDGLTATEMFSNEIEKFEDRMAAEKMDINPDTFIQSLEYLKKIDDFDLAISTFYNKYFEKMYIKPAYQTNTDISLADTDDIFDDNIYTDEYKKVTSKRPWTSEQSKALFVKTVEENWEEYKKVYQPFINYIKDHRGTLAGKKYDV